MGQLWWLFGRSERAAVTGFAHLLGVCSCCSAEKWPLPDGRGDSPTAALPCGAARFGAIAGAKRAREKGFTMDYGKSGAVKTGKNTVLNYLLKPVVKTLDESLGER